MMPEIHYTDALLTVIFGGNIMFAIWSANLSVKHGNMLTSLETKIDVILERLNGDRTIPPPIPHSHAVRRDHKERRF